MRTIGEIVAAVRQLPGFPHGEIVVLDNETTVLVEYGGVVIKIIRQVERQ